MRPRIKTGKLVACSNIINHKACKKHQIEYKYKEEFPSYKTIKITITK